jgi:hypothetical protein
MIYCCDKCKAEFHQKSNYEKHMNRKSPCVPEEKIQFDIDKRTCEYCKELYSSTKAVKVHMNICKKKPLGTEPAEPDLKEVISKLYTEIQEMKEKMNSPTNIINNNNTINVQNNIIVMPYGKEDLSFLTLKDYTKIFRKGCYSIPEILKLIHCNDDKPEFKNVYIKNYKDDYILTFDGKDWNVEKKDVILNNMLESKKYLLESKFDDMQEELPKHAITMFHKFLERSEDNEVIDNIKDEMKNMFYKNRNHVIKDIKKVKAIQNTQNIKKEQLKIENNCETTNVDIVDIVDIVNKVDDVIVNNKKNIPKKPAKKVITTKNVNNNEKKPKKKIVHK